MEKYEVRRNAVITNYHLLDEKQLKSSGLKNKNIEIIEYRYRFTDDEKERIREELKRGIKELEGKEEQEFISELEFYCQGFMTVCETNPKYPDLKIFQEDVLKNCKKTLRRLRDIVKFRIRLAPSFFVEGLEPKIDDWHRFQRECYVCAEKAIEPLESLVKLVEEKLKSQKKPPGRKKADPTNLIKQIAMSYFRYLHKIPTAYEDGTFMGIIRIAHEAVKLPSKDPSRAVRNVLRKLEKERQERGINKDKLLE